VWCETKTSVGRNLCLKVFRRIYRQPYGRETENAEVSSESFLCHPYLISKKDNAAAQRMVIFLFFSWGKSLFLHVSYVECPPRCPGGDGARFAKDESARGGRLVE
jgi:hypothetical protein